MYITSTTFVWIISFNGLEFLLIDRIPNGLSNFNVEYQRKQESKEKYQDLHLFVVW